MKAVALYLLFLLQFPTTHGEVVKFGSRWYTVVSQADCPDTIYDDPKQTGSYLLNKENQNVGQMTLSMDIQLIHYMTKPFKCFRAHPVFVNCMQDALSKLKADGKRTLVIGGFRPASVVTSTSEEDQFAIAGTALELRPQSNNPDDLAIIAQYILRYCPAKMERIQRNLGMVVKSSTMHVFMGGPSDPPVFRLDGYSRNPIPNQAVFIDLVNAAIIQGLELNKRASNCTRFTPLTSGQMYPVNAVSAEGTVGAMDIPVVRENTEDFTRMVQYLGSGVTFDNTERTASWCGSQGTACVDCRNGPVDATLSKRCTARMMTARMSNFLTLLQKLTVDTLSDSLRVTQAWDEDYENHVANTSSLHREGRALLVRLASGNTGDLGTLSQLAMCAEADFVQHNGDHLLIAMQKQHGESASEVEFPQATMVRVDAPASKNYLFKLPDNFTEEDHAEYPLLDSHGKETLQLAAHTTVGQFLSSQTRYFRMNPYVVDCLSSLQNYFVKREDADGPVTLEVVRAFMTTPERDVSFTINDHRYVSSVLGLSFEIRPNSSLSSQNVTLATLARLAVVLCTPVFQENEEQKVGVGLYPDRVYVDMRDTFLFWNPAGSFSSNVKNAGDFRTYLTGLFEAAKDGRIIDPDSPLEAKILAEPTLRQSITYRYVTPERILRSRNNTVDPGECQPKTSTRFCRMSQAFRQSLVTKGWAEAAKKHNYHDHDETKEAFEKCFSTCSTCMSGEVYETKVEHCSNYLHWAPFEMTPEGTAINLFPREHAAMRKCACQGGSHCVEDSALFLLLVNMFEAKFRQVPDNSVEDEMYPQTENPSPVAELLNQLYATHHQGLAKIWIQDDNDITSMRYTLEHLMVYNPNVTEVEVYVNETSTEDAVDSVLRNLIMEWTTSNSPLYREYVAPYTIRSLQEHCRITSKRATQQHNVRDEMINKINTMEEKYLRFDL